MRCKNCGWENPANDATCEKCSAPLPGLTGQEESNPTGMFHPKKTAKGCPACGYPIREMGKTCPHCGHIFNREKQEMAVVKDIAPQKHEMPAVKEVSPKKEPPPVPRQKPNSSKPVDKLCAFCKASIPETAQYCSTCGVSVTNEHPKVDDTIKPWVRVEQIHAPRCSLTIIDGDGKPILDSPLRFSGKTIQLSRSNTEPPNQTITSKTQAELSFENGKWYLQDKSALKTTYIYAGKKVELKPDDIIVLGNRLFKFNCDLDNQPE